MGCRRQRAQAVEAEVRPAVAHGTEPREVRHVREGGLVPLQQQRAHEQIEEAAH